MVNKRAKTTCTQPLMAELKCTHSCCSQSRLVIVIGTSLQSLINFEILSKYSRVQAVNEPRRQAP